MKNKNVPRIGFLFSGRVKRKTRGATRFDVSKKHIRFFLYNCRDSARSVPTLTTHLKRAFSR